MRKNRYNCNGAYYLLFISSLILWYSPQEGEAFTATINRYLYQSLNKNLGRTVTKTSKQTETTNFKMIKEGTNEREILAPIPSATDFFPSFGIAATMMAMIFLEPPSAPAAILPPSSVMVAAEVKTMDFSLPSSYSSISDAKANGAEELAVDISTPTGGGAAAKKPKPKKTTTTTEKTAVSLPQVAPKQQLTPEEKEALAKERSAAREAAEQERKQALAEKEAEKAALAAQKKAEQDELNAKRAVAREEERLAKKAAAVESAKATAESKSKTFIEQTKGSTSFSGGDFIDMGLPSYGSPNASGKKDSPFALNSPKK